MPSAIGRSNDAPALRTSAGARFTVMRCGGNWNPELRIALLTRSRLSRTLASGRPTIVKEGNPNDTSTSTCTAHASTPNTAAVRKQASTSTAAAIERRETFRLVFNGLAIRVRRDWQIPPRGRAHEDARTDQIGHRCR